MRRSQFLMVILGGSAHFRGPALAELEIPDAKLRQRVDEFFTSTMKGGAGLTCRLSSDHRRLEMAPLAPEKVLQPMAVSAGVGPHEISDGFDLNCAEGPALPRARLDAD